MVINTAFAEIAATAGRPAPPKPLPGFEHVKMLWNNMLQTYAARILPGEYYVTKADEGISTTLGSCISACIRDRVNGVGGMNHFMLPASMDGTPDMTKSSGLGAATRYGNFAMEHMINEILKNGGRKENFEVKIFGGGKIIAKMTDVGARNIAFVRDYLAAEGLKVVSEDVGEIFPRQVIYFPSTGRVKVKRIRSLHNNTIVEQELKYRGAIAAEPVSGEIELF